MKVCLRFFHKNKDITMDILILYYYDSNLVCLYKLISFSIIKIVNQIQFFLQFFLIQLFILTKP